MLNAPLLQTGVRILGGLVALAGVINFILAPIIGPSVNPTLWGVEPLAYIGAILVMAGLAVVSLSFVIPDVMAKKRPRGGSAELEPVQRWDQVTQHYFELFQHDLGRPLRRILGKERESRAILQSSGATIEPAIKELLDEIESQAPNFRLMLSNIEVLVQLEGPYPPTGTRPVEPTEMVRRITDRYTPVAAEAQKELTWWAEPAEFGIVYSDASTIEHVVVNLVDNAVRFAAERIEIQVTRNPTHFFIRVWDDGPGIAAHYLQHIFDRGWTPEVARREEKSSPGLGLFIASAMARRYEGEVTVTSVAAPDSTHHSAFLLSLPLGEPEVTLR